MPTCGNFNLVKLLGRGGFGIVYYAIHKETKEKCALKIIQNEAMDVISKQDLENEVETLKLLDHGNITKIIDCGFGELTTSNKSREVYYIALELAPGGEVFDFLTMSGEFKEDVARYYFRQLIEGIDYMHMSGIAHRDLKTENLLLDREFNLKIADFGYATQSKVNSTCVGTEDYMAPEVLKKGPYNGRCVDIFGAGLILFLMVTKNKPFIKADPKDQYYKYIAGNYPSKFWSIHLKHYGDNFISKELKDLIQNLLDVDPLKRFSISEIKTHPWYLKEVPTHEEIIDEFKKRNEEKIKKMEQNEEIMDVEYDPDVFTGCVKRSLGVSDSDSDEITEINRECMPYDEDFSSHTQFFSTAKLNDIWFTAAKFIKESTDDITFSSEEYSLSTKWIDSNEDSLEESKEDAPKVVNELSLNILKVEDEEKYCVELILLSGDRFAFHEMFKEMREFFGSFNSAA